MMMYFSDIELDVILERWDGYFDEESLEWGHFKETMFNLFLNFWFDFLIDLDFIY